MRLFLYLSMSVLVALVSLTSCGDNPINDKNDIKCDHLDADGMLIEHDDSVVATQWEGVVVGFLSVNATHSAVFSIVFLDQDSARSLPAQECTDHSLRWEIDDTTIARIGLIEGERWKFRVDSKAGGTTSVRFRLWHGDHTDFTSQPFSIDVIGAQPHVKLDPDAIALSRNRNDLASWNYDNAEGPNQAIGKLVAFRGQTLDNVQVRFLDTLQDQYGSRLDLVPSDSLYRLGWQVADPVIAELSPATGSPWAVNINGLQEGATTIIFKLIYEESVEFTAGAITLIVRTPLSSDSASADFSITKGGVWKTVFRNGANLEFDSICSRALPARLEVVEGELTDLFSFRLLTGCTRNEPRSSQYSLGFDFDDPCIAKALGHPVHWGEYFVFHLQGLAAGETSMRIHFIRANNTVEWTSPAIPVVVMAP